MLSREQQDIIEHSIWVVNSALKKQGLQADEDLRQSALLYMCKCLERFDPNKHIKWTTYAYKNVFLFIRRTHAKELKKNSLIINEDVYALEEPISQQIENDNQYKNNINRIENVKAICTIEEKRLIDLKLKGYKIVEISSLMKCSTSKIIGCMQSIREKAQENGL